MRKAGFNRLYQAGQVFEFSTPESLLDVDFSQPVFVLVDRLVVSAEVRSRIIDAIETAYRESGEVIFEVFRAPMTKRATMLATQTSILRFSQKYRVQALPLEVRRA